MAAKVDVKSLPACPVETTLTLIGDKWKVLILRDLMPGTKRFGELKKSIGSVSQKVLTAQLRDMEQNGLVHREVFAEVPPRVEYSLTELGRSLKPILDAMWELGRGVQSKERMSLCTWLHCVNDLGFSSQNTARRSSQANPWREYSCRFPLSTLYAGKPRTLTHDKLADFLGEWPPAGETQPLVRPAS